MFATICTCCLLQVHRDGDDIKYFSRRGKEHGAWSDFGQMVSACHWEISGWSGHVPGEADGCGR